MSRTYRSNVVLRRNIIFRYLISTCIWQVLGTFSQVMSQSCYADEDLFLSINLLVIMMTPATPTATAMVPHPTATTRSMTSEDLFERLLPVVWEKSKVRQLLLLVFSWYIWCYKMKRQWEKKHCSEKWIKIDLRENHSPNPNLPHPSPGPPRQQMFGLQVHFLNHQNIFFSRTLNDPH